ncbi:MAG: hypothetical protein QM791_03270 [Ferruginibacter sp.]
MQPEIFYKERITALAAALKKLEKKSSLLGWARLLSSVGIIPVLYGLWPYGWLYPAVAFIIWLVVFIRLVFTDLDNKASIRHHEQLLLINEDELRALRNDYFHFDEGNEHSPHEHFYSNDLDIFGKASLFQYINRSTSAMGSKAMAGWLLNPAGEKTIIKRQEASKELYKETNWRQALHAYGRERKIQAVTYERLQEWLNEEDIFLTKPLWMILQWAVPVIMITGMLLNAFAIISDPVRNILLLFSGILALFIAKKAVPLHNKVSKITDELSVLTESIRLIETKAFHSALLLQFQSAFKQPGTNASMEMKKLKGIVQRMDWRLNPVVFIPLALLSQWDLQQVIALEKWKRKNHQNITAWFDSLGDFEAISSLATLHFNHPDWCFPVLSKEHFYIDGKQVGHPMINPLKRVNNSIAINDKGIIMLVTGSNMAGKSTYLRSIGINTVLTMAGAVVCAETFSISPVQLLTSMRIADNLEENTSTFYAELKKLKTVIEKVNNHEPVFILLDEILRGTNSFDRHTGAVALTRQLIKQQAAAVIATHDVELAALKETYPDSILNYHFDVQVNNEELYFDYRLKEGICNSLNASILMKKIGIEL